MNRESHRVPRPPSVHGVEVPAPLIDPPLRGMPEWPGRPLDSEPERFEVEVVDHLGDMLIRASELAREDERVRKHLGSGRHVWIGPSALDRKDDEGPLAVVVVFDYERGVAVEVAIGGEGDELRVLGVEDAAYHPPPSDEEVTRATELSREDRRVVGHLSEELEATAILVSDVEQGDRHFGTRRIEIGFGRADERLPRIRALVDLGEDRVLGVHAESEHRDELPEEGS
jgi:hypothetical protein